MIVTISMLENAITVITAHPDGTQANQQAREFAAKVLNAQADHLQEFLDKNPDSPIAVSVSLQIANLRNLYGHKV